MASDVHRRSSASKAAPYTSPSRAPACPESLALGDLALTDEEFEELAHLKVPLIQIRGQWVEINPENLKYGELQVGTQIGETQAVFPRLDKTKIMNEIEQEKMENEKMKIENEEKTANTEQPDSASAQNPTDVLSNNNLHIVIYGNSVANGFYNALFAI